MSGENSIFQAVLTIDLAALVANWRLLAEKTQPATCAAVVKANAYGVGLEPAVRALHRAGCRMFFVARLPEGFRARACAPDADIYVLDGLPEDCAAFLQIHNLRPVLGSLAEIAEWRSAGGGPAALHFDTGMYRLGLSLADAAQAFALLGAPPALILSHFTSSENPGELANQNQIDVFAAVRVLSPNSPSSLCNSSGIFLPQKPWLNVVRPGYALYGGNPTPDAANPMASVVSLHAPILAVRSAPEGARVGYNGQWTARRPTRLAIMALGYADGILRSAMGTDVKRGPDVFLDDYRCEIVGRISMDLTAVDVTDAPESIARRGAMIEVLGPNVSVDAFAKAAGTIGYEILTGFSDRYRRVYCGDA